MKKYNIILSGTTKKVNYTELKKYDVVNIEYGDFDCFVKAIVLDITIEPSKGNPERDTIKLHFATQSGRENDAFDMIYTKGKYLFDLIGKAEICENEEQNAPAY